MNLAKLLKKSFDAGFSPAKNKDIAPYFWAFVGSITIVSAIFPSLPLLSFLAQLGGMLFFVIMTSYLTRNEDADWPGPSTKLLGRRSLEIIGTCLDVFITTAIAGVISLIGLFLLIIPAHNCQQKVNLLFTHRCNSKP